MTHPVLNSKEPIRVFKSDFLEYFTHIKPVVIAVVWIPTSLLLILWGTLRGAPASLPLTLGAILAGLFTWTVAEYLLHRFLFHAAAHGPASERMLFLLHGIHHAQPMVKTRLVMPLPISIPLALVFYGFFHLLFSLLFGIAGWLNPFMGGFLLGYTAYDLTHYAIHHFKSDWAYFKLIRRTHLHHHTGIPVRSYGVTSPLWDIVFGTLAGN